MNAPNETPVDLAAVQADDALLDALTSALYDDDAELARVLVAWRRDVDAEPIGELVDTDTALAGINASRRVRRGLTASSLLRRLVLTVSRRTPAYRTAGLGGGIRRRRRHPVLGPVAAAVAVLVIAFSGVGLVAKSAHPDDQLWGLTKVLYADYARSVEAATDARAALRAAGEAADQGHTDRARDLLAQVRDDLLPTIASEQGHQEIATTTDQLSRRIEGGK